MQRDFFAGDVGHLRVIEEELPVLGLVDEAEFGLGEVGGDEVVGAEGEEGVVEFRVRGIDEGGDAVWRWVFSGRSSGSGGTWALRGFRLAVDWEKARLLCRASMGAVRWRRRAHLEHKEAMGAMWWQMHWRQAAFESEMQVEMLGIPASPQTTLVPRSPFDTTLT